MLKEFNAARVILGWILGCNLVKFTRLQAISLQRYQMLHDLLLSKCNLQIFSKAADWQWFVKETVQNQKKMSLSILLCHHFFQMLTKF